MSLNDTCCNTSIEIRSPLQLTQESYPWPADLCSSQHQSQSFRSAGMQECYTRTQNEETCGCPLLAQKFLGARAWNRARRNLQLFRTPCTQTNTSRLLVQLFLCAPEHTFAKFKPSSLLLLHGKSVLHRQLQRNKTAALNTC